MAEQNQMLITIHNSLLVLIGDVAAVKQSIENMANNHDNLRKDVSKLDERMDTIERQRIADNSSWRGPKTLITIASAVVVLLVGVAILMDKF